MNIAAVRNSIESLYEDRCAIYEQVVVQDSETKITRQEWEAVTTNQPCRLSFKTLVAVQEASPGAGITQTIKLFLAPEITVKPGSRIEVIRGGVTYHYASSGLPAIYPTHQEILLKAEGWA